VSGFVVDTSVWIDFFAGVSARGLEEALRAGAVVLPPVVVAELVSGARTPEQAGDVKELVERLEVHRTDLDHWIAVGTLRRRAADRGVALSTPDAHVATCALDRGAVLLSRDKVFRRLADFLPLEVREG
jgi:tRNA(fMet)-specific endonuclease VapC